MSDATAGGRISARPAPSLRSVAALAALELRLTARRGENVLVTLVIPAAVLLFFGGVAVPPGLPGRPADHLLPGTIALAIVAAGLVNLGIATAYERSYGVLKRLGGAPLPRWGLLAAKAGALLVLELVQVLVLVAVAVVAFGWAPGPGWSPILATVAVAIGTLAFAALGLLLAGTLRAEATLALANGLFLAFLMLGGLVVPVEGLPPFLRPIAAILPATALADLLRIALDSGVTPQPGGVTTAAMSIVLLGAWAAGAGILAVRFFRWDAEPR
jgi:ABC-2 type transport system permease protein